VALHRISAAGLSDYTSLAFHSFFNLLYG
jgi:hypothetical protein